MRKRELKPLLKGRYSQPLLIPYDQGSLNYFEHQLHHGNVKKYK